MSGARIPSPGPSFARVEPLRLRGAAGQVGARVRLGMAKPSIMEDGWWLTTLWAEDDDGVLEARAVAPTAGPPPTPPLAVIGPTLSGALMGLLEEENGRQLIRLRMPPADDEAQPWRRPLMLLVAVRWDPIRASTMRTNQLAGELMRAFRQAIDVAGAPGRGI
ncbi:MAG: hypothetical protein ACC726_02125 [Chloroflexota bacterium]